MNSYKEGQQPELIFTASPDMPNQWLAETAEVQVRLTLQSGGLRSLVLQEFSDVSFVPCIDRLFPSSRCPAGLVAGAMSREEYSACKADCRWREHGLTSWHQVSGFEGLGVLRRELGEKTAQVHGSESAFLMTWVIDGKKYRAPGQGVMSKAIEMVKQLTKTVA